MEDYIDNLIDIGQNIEHDKITLLTGRNSGGKSLIRKVLKQLLSDKIGKEQKDLFIPHASQELRTNSNPSLGALSGFAHDLEWLATSTNTISTIKSVLSSNEPDYIVIDEPEIGLGEELQLGLVNYLNEELPKLSCKGILIICHSRIIAKNIKFDNFINLEGMSYDEWINRTPKPISIEEFEEFGGTLFKAVRDRLKN